MPLHKLRVFAAISLLIVLSLFLGGCPGGSSGGGGGAGGNILKYALQTNPTNLDPARVEDGDTIDLLQNIFEGLVQWNEKSEIVPNLAEKWDVSPDGKVYTFHLKDNVKFHNGRKLVAADFVYSMTRALQKETRSATAMVYLNDIVGAKALNDGVSHELPGVKAVDENTLQITLDNRHPYFLGKLTYPTGWAYCKEEIEKNGNTFNEKTMIGTGPFKLQSYQSGYAVVLKANDDYHQGRPVLDGIERPVKTDTFARQTAYESGELHFTDVQRGELERIKKDAALSGQLKQFNRANIYYLALNQLAFPPFKDKRVRQAFAHAINKDSLIQIALKGIGIKANGIVPPGVPGQNPSFAGLDYDPAKARTLLAQAGYSGGKGFPKLVISYRQGWAHIDDGANVIRNELKENLGIDIDLRKVEWGQFLTERRNGTMPCFHLRWAADYLDEQDFLSLMLRTGSEENKVGYSNPEFDKLCDQADVEADPAKRAELYAKAEKIVVDDAPWVCLYFLPDVELHKPGVKGIRDSLMGHLPHTKTTVAK
jgi:ABC-type transport system substrate-binding protein